MSDPAISYQAVSAAGNPRRRLLLAGLFILLCIGLCNVAARALNMESSRNQLHAWALDPGHGWADSWDPMIAALDWLQEPHAGKLYESIFFQQQIKFQYPPTSLLPLAVMRAAGQAVPETHGLRLAECARMNTVAENLDEARGARRRARQGRLGEPPARQR